MTELTLNRISYVYSEGTPFCHRALDDVNLTIRGGVITGLMGHTGSGKSTLVQLLNGLLKPKTGEILIDGKNIWDDPKQIRQIRFRVGLVFQYPEYQLFEETVAKDIAFGPANMGLPPEEIDRRTREAMRFVGLGDEYLEKSPFDLSGGQKRRVAVAGVMAMEPEILILDEPAAGLDPMGREEILGGIHSYQRRVGNTVIIVSHSMEDMARYADRLVVMQNGSVAADGTNAEIFRNTELLASTGLDVPQITRLCRSLREKGLPLPQDLYTVEAARHAICELYRNRRGGTEQ